MTRHGRSAFNLSLPLWATLEIAWEKTSYRDRSGTDSSFTQLTLSTDEGLDKRGSLLTTDEDPNGEKW
ncbi:hypothetical protein N7539_001124 [Penicillium diatomitis]|uniref:Uncharacterized protein n=1 Tax=Penicillium diatomitis TaxID=2819901 RepID=A0A9W9XN08_9EURO|nr:uncharacterized protein N7539_001124 [Penicillium diatomitis]KAJ5496008.1 hypothetical protein N7539_001124 [Penicillium diatomitis]